MKQWFLLLFWANFYYYYPKNVKKKWFIKIKKFKSNLKFYCMKKAPNSTQSFYISIILLNYLVLNNNKTKFMLGFNSHTIHITHTKQEKKPTCFRLRSFMHLQFEFYIDYTPKGGANHSCLKTSPLRGSPTI